jgi:hypothetical protein
MSRTVPSTIQHIPSDLVSPTDYNTYAAGANTFLTTVPIFVGYQATTQLLTNNTVAAISLDMELVDSDGGHSPTVNNSRYTAQVAGWYAVSGVVSFVSNGSVVRLAYIVKNGTGGTVGAYVEYTAASAGITSVPLNVQIVQLNVGDYVELYGFQNSGGSLNTSVTTQSTSSMSVWWVGHV